jgi:hypothetical protein
MKFFWLANCWKPIFVATQWGGEKMDQWERKKMSVHKKRIVRKKSFWFKFIDFYPGVNPINAFNFEMLKYVQFS